MLIYSVSEFFTGNVLSAGSGSIPASAVQVSGGSLNTGKLTLMLSLNTCDLGSTYTTSNGSCGNFNLTWTEVPPSVGGSFASRGDTVQTTGGTPVVTVRTNGSQLTVGASVSGSMLNGSVPTPIFGQLVQQTNVTVTITR